MEQVVVDLTVDSPGGKRKRGGRPGGALFRDEKPDPHDEKVLLTVKEAAWMLSLPESAIRRAAVDADVDRVYFGNLRTSRPNRVRLPPRLGDSVPRDSHQWWR